MTETNQFAITDSEMNILKLFSDDRQFYGAINRIHALSLEIYCHVMLDNINIRLIKDDITLNGSSIGWYPHWIILFLRWYWYGIAFWIHWNAIDCNGPHGIRVDYIGMQCNGFQLVRNGFH